MLIEVVRRLAAEIDERWARACHSIESFAAIAAAALERHRPHDHLDLGEFGDWLSTTSGLPEPVDPGTPFADPPVTLWRSARFVVDIHFWITPETSLHDHGFVGAFANLMGESLHGVYRMGAVDEPEPGVMVTSLELRALERLDRGSVRPIHGGRQFVHRVSHISRPTVTLSVRTVGQVGWPQYTYFYPSIGLLERRQQDEQDQMLQKRRQFLSFLASTADPRLESYVKQLIDRSDARVALGYVLYLNHWIEMELVEHLSLLHRLLEHLTDRFGGWIDHFGSALEHSLKEQRVHWHAIHDVDQRFLAALLSTSTSRAEIIEAIKRYREPIAPVEWLTQRLKGLIEVGGLAVIVNDRQFCVLRDLILSWPDADAVAVPARAGPGQTGADGHSLCAALKQIDIFRPLFTAA